MTTKAQETKALDQIKEIIAGLGNDSYLAAAFAGCCEDAADNIRDDAAYSMRDRWLNERDRADQLAAKLADAERVVKKAREAQKAADDGAGIIAQKLRDAEAKRLPSEHSWPIPPAILPLSTACRRSRHPQPAATLPQACLTGSKGTSNPHRPAPEVTRAEEDIP